MKVARELERRLEAVLDGLAGRLFRGGLHPSEIAARIAREAELAQFETPAGPATANRFVITLNPANLAGGEDAFTTAMAEKLAVEFSAVAADRGWRLEGPVEVVVALDPDLPNTGMHCEASVAPGQLTPWGWLAGDRQLGIGPNRAIIGRASDCDLVVDAAQVSRHHALLFRQDGQAYVVDLESANGTAVDGRPVKKTPVKLELGSVLTLAGLDFRFSPSRTRA
ncbi:MAG TPA: FhaA domain-containing protein [Acidimicrobiia bacterium]|nr:FhaA domain-containing protein [Acidimicrobiia bacterium]